MIRNVLSSVAMIATLASPALSQEIILGAGYSDYSTTGAENGVVLSVEYAHSPFWERGNFSAGFAGAIEVVDTGDAFIGGGLNGTFDLQRNWFIQASVMPGAYFESAPLNDLGSTFEIRSQLAVGKRFNNGKALSLALGHKSNASTADINPGVNVVSLRWHVPLN